MCLHFSVFTTANSFSTAVDDSEVLYKFDSFNTEEG